MGRAQIKEMGLGGVGSMRRTNDVPKARDGQLVVLRPRWGRWCFLHPCNILLLLPNQSNQQGFDGVNGGEYVLSLCNSVDWGGNDVRGEEGQKG